MTKLGKDLVLGEVVRYVDKFTRMSCRVVMCGRNKGFFTSTGFVKIKQRTEYEVVA